MARGRNRRRGRGAGSGFRDQRNQVWNGPIQDTAVTVAGATSTPLNMTAVQLLPSDYNTRAIRIRFVEVEMAGSSADVIQFSVLLTSAGPKISPSRMSTATIPARLRVDLPPDEPARIFATNDPIITLYTATASNPKVGKVRIGYQYEGDTVQNNQSY